jgi:hypothetical protein
MPSSSDAPTSGTPAQNPGRAFTIAAFALAGLGLVMFPLGGLAGGICAALGHSRGDRPLALVALAASVVSFIASFFVAAWVLG